MSTMKVIQGPVDLIAPPDAPDGQVWRYGLGFPFQVAPRMAGIFVNVEVECTENYGFLNGTDVVLFDDLSAVRQGRTIAITRNEICRNLETQRDELILQSPMVGGFVPLGAKREAGAPHPLAGSGFGIAQAHVFPGYKDGRFVWWEPGRRYLRKVVQRSYSGEQFHRARDSVYSQNTDSPLSVADTGWHIISHGLTSAIPDGDDLLLPVLAGRIDAADAGVGVARWRREEKTWRIVSFDLVASGGAPVAGASLAEHTAWFEPSLARDANGTLWFCARGQDGGKTPDGLASGNLVPLWRSDDGAKSWNLFAVFPTIRNEAPVTVNCAADGTVYVVSNPFDPDFKASPKTGRGRERVFLWTVDVTRRQLDPPIVVRNATAEFGPPPASPDPEWVEAWMLDHPNAGTIRLADGRWHHLLVYRIKHSPLCHSLKTVPAPQVGCYVDEVISSGPTVPGWNFGQQEG